MIFSLLHILSLAIETLRRRWKALTLSRPGGGGGLIMPAATFNLIKIFNIWANGVKYQDFFRNLSGKNLMWSVSDDWVDFRK